MPNLIQQVLEALGPDGVWQELNARVSSLQTPKNDQVEVRALCPFHDDHRPSWCWNLAKGVATCHVCGEGDYSLIGYIAYHTGRPKLAVLDEYCRRLGLARPRRHTLTLADYAAAKRLPEGYLQGRFGLTDTENGLEIPYFDPSGMELARRLRRRLGERPRWKGNGVAARRMVYCLHGLPWIGPTGYVFIVEGESDLHTAWYYDLPAWGMPGASVGHQAIADIVVQVKARTVYVLPHEDRSGHAMLERSSRSLKRAGWTGSLLVARLPAKDVSELHIELGNGFERALWASLHRAIPAEQALAEFEQRAARGDTTMVRITHKILNCRDLKPVDKLILIAAAAQVATDPTQPIPLTRAALARRAGVPRRTFFDHLPRLLHLGLLEVIGTSLRLGNALVR